jgi:hypothetical protein
MHAQAATDATMDAPSPEMTVTDFEWTLDLIREYLATATTKEQETCWSLCFSLCFHFYFCWYLDEGKEDIVYLKVFSG